MSRLLLQNQRSATFMGVVRHAVNTSAGRSGFCAQGIHTTDTQEGVHVWERREGIERKGMELRSETSMFCF